MPRRKRAKKRSRTTRPKAARRTTARARRTVKRRQVRAKETHYNPLMVFIMFLYMLRLIDEKQFKRFQRDLSPRKKPAAKRRRRQS